MPPKRATTSGPVSAAKRARGVAESPSGDDVNVVLAKALQRIASMGDGFRDAVAAFGALNEEAVRDKKMELDGLNAQLAEARKRLELEREEGKLRAETEARRYRAEIETKRMEDDMALAVAILEASGKVPIDGARLKDMEARLAGAEEELQRAVAAARTEVAATMRAEMERMRERHELVTEKEAATLKARIDQLEVDIKTKAAFIAELKDMMDKQRELTASVAKSASMQNRGATFGHEECAPAGSGVAARRR